MQKTLNLAFAKKDTPPHIPAPFFMFNWIGLLISVLKLATVFVCILLVFVVLLQRPKNEGLGAAFGGETASNLFGAQTTNVLASVTRWLGGIFLFLCFAIAWLSMHDRDRLGAIEDYKKHQAELNAAEANRKKTAEEAEKAKEATKGAAAPEKDIDKKPTAVTPPANQPSTDKSEPEKKPAPAAPANTPDNKSTPTPPKTEGQPPAPATPEAAPKQEPPKPATPAAEPPKQPAPSTQPAPASDASKPADKPAEKPADPKPNP